jgi:hypothetical protein
MVSVERVEAPETMEIVEGLNVAVAPGIDDMSIENFTVPVIPPRL